MTPEDREIWDWLRARSLVAQFAWYYLTGEYYLICSQGLLRGNRL